MLVFPYTIDSLSWRVSMRRFAQLQLVQASMTLELRGLRCTCFTKSYCFTLGVLILKAGSLFWTTPYVCMRSAGHTQPVKLCLCVSQLVRTECGSRCRRDWTSPGQTATITNRVLQQRAPEHGASTKSSPTQNSNMESEPRVRKLFEPISFRRGICSTRCRAVTSSQNFLRQVLVQVFFVLTIQGQDVS